MTKQTTRHLLDLRARPLDPSQRFYIRNDATGECFLRRAAPSLGEPLRPEFNPYREVCPKFSRPFAERLLARCLQDDPTLTLSIQEA